ncbi:PucR family transcriptional regulator [Streptomyces sp. NBC_00572]|uniref:PucR family transcriptional regulator ligand-binding domain-containing protein n=1 Tax=Streptomyces sp. NBC_00572 TaxID=2903664 RepID=UPI00225992D0|nr:PucR family transcriptional regulator [Streptomyces sp. NBC_00572]MCX4981022.1 PucR family transcriptional regulator [Streptomyces sp. NBC_00572]
MTSAEPTSTPPAPPVSLAALLARRDLGLRLLAGPGDVSIHWVHTSEMADPYPYLLGGELLMTAGVQLTDPAHYVERVVEAGAAALGFGVTPVYDTVPAELVEACDRLGLPLVEVPPRTPFTAVARALWRLMAEARLHELRRVTEAQQSLAAAAARPAPVPAVLGALASRLGGRAVLFGADGTESVAAGRDVPAEAARALRDLAGVLGPRPGGPASASGDGGGLRLAAYALGGGDGLTLGVATERRGPGDHTIAGVAVVLLSLLTAPHRGADVTVRDGALVRLLLGATPAETAAALGAGPWTVVHASGGDGTPFAAASLAAALGTPLVDAGGRARGGGGSGGTTAGAGGSGGTTAGAAFGAVQLLLPASSPVTAQSGWTLGVSAPVEADELAAADAQAARALRRAEATGAELVRHRPGGIAALVDPDEATAHARALLAPLTEPLAETLRVWLSLHGGWDRTATAMDIHRNTVRQRIARCAALLDRDLDDPDVRMELWFALTSR